MSQTKFIRFADRGIKSMGLIFQTEILIYQSKAKVDEKILLGKIIHHLGPEFSLGMTIPHSILVHDLPAVEL